ncbi:hypothetical protein ABT173_29200 [Streptomyces sp. NPDC001795]|uniref:hypothetical protein n=1 Tax=unclassified Streptomyces TaxID=2593676 RepID=UPI0033277B69
MFIELGRDPDFLKFLLQFRENIDADALGAATEADPELWMRQVRGAVQAPGMTLPSWFADASLPLPGTAQPPRSEAPQP